MTIDNTTEDITPVYESIDFNKNNFRIGKNSFVNYSALVEDDTSLLRKFYDKIDQYNFDRDKQKTTAYPIDKTPILFFKDEKLEFNLISKENSGLVRNLEKIKLKNNMADIAFFIECYIISISSKHDNKIITEEIGPFYQAVTKRDAYILESKVNNLLRQKKKAVS